MISMLCPDRGETGGFENKLAGDRLPSWLPRKRHIAEENLNTAATGRSTKPYEREQALQSVYQFVGFGLTYEPKRHATERIIHPVYSIP
jgi:hypothetical protein